MAKDASTFETARAPTVDGCLVLADISGYTAYLEGAELEHASDVLTDLLETLVGRMRPVLEVLEVEGDAVFAWADSDAIGASMLLDAVESTYFAFRARLRDVTRLTTCRCEACKLIPNLDLKFIVHAGTFVLTEVAGNRRLTGSDVVVAHRLLKNDVREDTGLHAYAFLTESTMVALHLDPNALDVSQHVEAVDGVEVAGCVLDLDRRWRDEQERQRVFVLPKEAGFADSRVFAAGPEELWEWHTDPERRLQWQTSFDSIRQSSPSKRRGPGTTTHCAHGRSVILEEILDWRPFHYYTARITMPMIGPVVFTTEFVPLEDGTTEVRARAAALGGWRRVVWRAMTSSLRRSVHRDDERLDALLASGDRSAPKA